MKEMIENPELGQTPADLIEGGNGGWPNATTPARMSNAQIKHMVDRFLSWKLPGNFSPDAGISYVRPNYPAQWSPFGTNLFDATQADAMVRYMIDGMPVR